MPRCSLLMIFEDLPLPEAVGRCADLADEFRRESPFAPSVSRQELYAVGAAGRIQAKIRPPHPLVPRDAAATELGSVHAIWARGRWQTPDKCRPAPPDDNGASAWQWAHYDAVMNATPTAWMVLWDLELAGELAA
ncbi:hypothetical protein [Zhihengliuella salsuginis]|uniref:Uncharacterized protein n=1 Tax=Zhihengliuella salsuginis TaxID=578222 RepID=A0ABQ3GJ58_9MICC|nr:hypothetical protein [Zhihengliuella salsuginis]GHD10137.1 hypothetical protein GCM10008096_23380 [Zhihengliuella salsuginis]